MSIKESNHPHTDFKIKISKPAITEVGNNEFLINGINMACVYGKEEVKLTNPKSINGKYKGINTDKDELGNKNNEEKE